MKSLLVGLFCLALGVSDSLSQGKVLIIASDSSGFSADSHTPLGISRIQDALTKSYTAEVETRIGIFPDTLTTYDAIFTDLYFYDGGDSVFIASELEKLTRYLSVGGRLYIQVTLNSAFYRQFASDDPPPYSEYPPFREFVGLTKFGVASSAIQGIKVIQGMPNFFSEGLLYKRNTNPAEFNAPSILSLEGNVTEILRADDYSIGWQHEKQDAKVVWHWPIVPEHYDEFIGRVVCNYFGLCEPLDVAEAEAVGTFSVTYDPVRQVIDLHHAEDFHTVEVYSMLGIRLLTGPIDGESISISHSLPSGNYLVVARGVGRVGARAVVIWK